MTERPADDLLHAIDQQRRFHAAIIWCLAVGTAGRRGAPRVTPRADAELAPTCAPSAALTGASRNFLLHRSTNPGFWPAGHALPTGRSPSVRMGDIAMTTPAKPAMRPARPEFSSGPCAKRPGWTPENLQNAVLGRSHRSKLGKARLKDAIDRTREVLEVPDDYLIGIVPGSDTGAVEMAMWSMLGPRPVQLLAFESFGKDWVTDVTKQLKLDGRGAGRALRRAAGPDQGAPGRRPGVHLERHHLRRARAQRRLHRRRPRGHRPSATPPAPPSPRTSTGPSSMWSPSPGRRRWAARPRTAC